jgi:ATP-dependent Clp protease ATP-binding subunit ClpB
MLDDGRLTDGQGRTIDFKNTVVVMTSNIGSQQIQELTSKGADDWEIEAAVREQLRAFLRPELLNRIDETIIFHQLKREQIASIVEIQLERLRQRLAEREISIELKQSAIDAIANEGYDPVYGARPLKRVIQQRLENPIASRILAGEIEDGQTITVDYEGKSFTFGAR